MIEWANKTGINKTTLQSRLRSGWTTEKSLTEPVNKKFSSYKHTESNLKPKKTS